MEQNMTKPYIRLASLEEASIVLSLWQSSANWLITKGINQWRPEFFSLEQVIEFMTNGSEVYLAEIDNKYIGTYTVTWSDPFIWKELDNKDSGYIHRFAVNRNFKGLGIGYSLLQSAEVHIKQKGKTLIRLDCMADNIRLNQYYKDYGFNFIRRMNINDKGWSANLYEKK